MFVYKGKKYLFKFPTELIADTVLVVPDLKKFTSAYTKSNGNLLLSLKEASTVKKRVKSNIYIKEEGSSKIVIVEFDTEDVAKIVTTNGNKERFTLGFLVANCPSSTKKLSTWFQSLVIPSIEKELDRLEYRGRIKSLSLKYPFGDNFLVFDVTTIIKNK